MDDIIIIATYRLLIFASLLPAEFDLSESPPVPHGALYGSQGVSLHDAAQTSVTSVRIDLSPFKFDAKRTPCSLDKLGIVPAQPLARRRFASLSNLRLSFKSYPPLASQTPVMIREVVPGSPAAASQQLMSGQRAVVPAVYMSFLVSYSGWGMELEWWSENEAEGMCQLGTSIEN